MGTALMKLLAGFLILLCISCALNGEPLGEITDSVEIHNIELVLTSENGDCKLNLPSSLSSAQLVMAVKPPCHFLRRGDANPQSFSYGDVGVDAVLIVAGQPLGEEKRKTWNLPDALICGEEIQGVLIKGKMIHLSKTVLRGSVYCKDKGVDEKDFWLFAHEKG